MGSPQMAFQWNTAQLLEEMKALDKFLDQPGIRHNFIEALDKFQIPQKTRRKWAALMQLLQALEGAGRPFNAVTKVIVWKKDEPNKYRLQIEFLRPAKKHKA